MPSDSKKKRELKKKEAAKKRDVKKPLSAVCDTVSDGDTVAGLTDGATEAETCNGADDGASTCTLV